LLEHALPQLTVALPQLADRTGDVVAIADAVAARQLDDAAAVLVVQDRQSALGALDVVHAARLPPRRGQIDVAAAEQGGQLRAGRRREGARRPPVAGLRPAADHPQLDARE